MNNEQSYLCPHCGKAFIIETDDLFKIKEKGFQITKNDNKLKIWCLNCKREFIATKETAKFLKDLLTEVA